MKYTWGDHRPLGAAELIAIGNASFLAGRLACISFGCCYGKPLDQCPAWLAKIFSRFHFIFSGKTKKIAYAHGWDGRPVVPVQGLTAILSSGAALIGIDLFLKGQYGAAFWTPLVITQAWRFVSEPSGCWCPVKMSG